MRSHKIMGGTAALSTPPGYATGAADVIRNRIRTCKTRERVLDRRRRFRPAQVRETVRNDPLVLPLVTFQILRIDFVWVLILTSDGSNTHISYCSTTTDPFRKPFIITILNNLRISDRNPFRNAYSITR